MSDRAYRKVINSWAMYDWANSSFGTTILCAMFPPLYRSMATAAGVKNPTSAWAYTITIALIIIAVIGPVLGAISDYTGRKKMYIGFFALLGIFSSAGLVWLGEDTYILGSVLFILGNIGFAGGNVFYESLLPHITRGNDMDQISSNGYALGYAGAGILLILNASWFIWPEKWGLINQDIALKACFFSVAAWWALFSIPFFRNVPDAPCVPHEGMGSNPVSAGFRRLGDTFKHLRQYKQVLLFLVAFWVYSDGINTIIKMATAYGDEIRIDMVHMIKALIITQFVGIPATLVLAKTARKIGAKRTILICLAVYTCVSVGAGFMSAPVHFYILATTVGFVQGGAQALSRSLYGSMVPKERSSEFFGFMSTSSRFAGIFGPLIFGAVGDITGSSRASMISLVIFFVVGAALLSLVDEDAGKAARGNNA